MTGDEAHLIAKGEEPLADGGDEVPVVAPGKVRSSDGTLEDDITHLRQPVRGGVEDHVTRRVARTMNDFQLNPAHLDQVPLIKPLIGGKGRDWREAEGSALAGQRIQQEGILPVRSEDGQVQMFSQEGGGTHMIKMSVGEQDFFQLNPRSRDQSEESVQITPWIDDCGPLGLITPEKGAILLVGRHGQDAIFQH